MGGRGEMESVCMCVCVCVCVREREREREREQVMNVIFELYNVRQTCKCTHASFAFQSQTRCV